VDFERSSKSLFRDRSVQSHLETSVSSVSSVVEILVSHLQPPIL